MEYLANASEKVALLLNPHADQVLLSAVLFVLVTILFTFALSVVTGNMSIVDMLWSIIPVILSWWFTYNSPTHRAMFMTVLITIWGVRLSLNLLRKDGYSLVFEDYRWSITRNNIRTFVPNKILYNVVLVLFNLFFVSSFQIILLLLITLPVYIVANSPASGPWFADYALVIIWSAFLYCEMQGDYELHVFRQKKQELIEKKAKDASVVVPQFVNTGLYHYSRHPNFFGEQAMWVTLWAFVLFSQIDSRTLLVSAVGPVVLLLLFQASTQLTESIAISRYPEYIKYIETTSKFIPMKPSVNKKD